MMSQWLGEPNDSFRDAWSSERALAFLGKAMPEDQCLPGGEPAKSSDR